MDWNELDVNNIKTAFQMNGNLSNTESSWTDYVKPVQGRIRPLHTLEDYQKKVQLILEEFSQFDENQKTKILPLISEWLSDVQISDDDQKSQQVRDFIYEMF